VVAEYGLIIPERLLSLPKYGTVNLHGSLLPKYRGASPIQAAILNGETETGITLMLMDKKMDHGPVISTIITPISNNELFLSLYQRLAQLAADLFLRDIRKFIEEVLKPQPQDEGRATYCTMLNRDDGKVDFSKTAKSIFDQYRAFTPWPGLWTVYEGKRLKLGEISPTSGLNLEPGAISTDKNRITIGCGENTAIEVKSLQMEGKKLLSALEFLRGERNFGKSRFV
jgi:methionyl-tRNA formyltransferase